MKYLKLIGEKLLKAYMAYSDFVHSIFRDELGDYIVFLINIIVIIGIIKLVASAAFQTKSRG